MTNELQATHISAAQRRIHWATFIAVSVVFVAALVHESVDSESARGLSLSLYELFGLADMTASATPPRWPKCLIISTR
jgi:cytochrome b561